MRAHLLLLVPTNDQDETVTRLHVPTALAFALPHFTKEKYSPLFTWTLVRG